MLIMDRNASHYILQTIRNVLVFESQLYIAQVGSYRQKTRFGDVQAIDLTSEVTG